MPINLIEKIAALDWNCSDSDTQYLTHSIHRYSGKFIPQIAKQAIELLTEPGDLILDPYCGSGTTLLEAALLGRRSLGIDLNPLAVLIASVKNSIIEPEKIKRFQQSLELSLFGISEIIWNTPAENGLFSAYHTTDEINHVVQSDSRWFDTTFHKWFQERPLRELIVLDHIINREGDVNLRQVATLAFSDILRRSSNAHGGYPNVMFHKNKGDIQPVIPQFIKRLGEIIPQICELKTALAGKPLPGVVLADNTKLPVGDASVKAVITHPPYIASIPYAEYGVLSLMWLGVNPKELDKKLTGGRRHSKDVVVRFREDFSKMIAETYRVLVPGGNFFMLLGNPTVNGFQVDLSTMAQEIAQNTTFRLIAKYQRNGINRRANLMGKEDMLFFEK